MKTLWLFNRAENTITLAEVPAHLLPELQMVRCLCGGEWVTAYEWAS